MKCMQKNTKSKIAYIVIAIIFVICIFLIIFKPASSNPIATIWVGGEKYKEINLAKAEDEILKVKSVTFEIKNHEIRFISSDCPDKICIHTGWIKNPTESAHCLPNKISLTIR